jgi:hypothetical protein
MGRKILNFRGGGRGVDGSGAAVAGGRATKAGRLRHCRGRPAALPAPPDLNNIKRLCTAASSPWTSMPEDLVSRVAECVVAGDLLDYVRFRAVCRRCRSFTADPRGRGVSDPGFHLRGWTMLHGRRPRLPDGLLLQRDTDAAVLLRWRRQLALAAAPS